MVFCVHPALTIFCVVSSLGGRWSQVLRSDTKTIAADLADLRCAELSIMSSPTKSIVLEVWLRWQYPKCCAPSPLGDALVAAGRGNYMSATT
uniref:Secreted protein n=1 Tax=Glossina palpalis gambiensis TaxID=67801 RepID=A0A1B0BXY5_9MUSC